MVAYPRLRFRLSSVIDIAKLTFPNFRGVYIGKSLPPAGRGISADVIWGENMKKGETFLRREVEERERKKGERGVKIYAKEAKNNV
jgi:hypothetical protein